MVTASVAVGLALVAGAPWPGGLQGPQVELWTDRDYGAIYHRGERVRLYFRTDQDAYVTVLRVDTDGRVRMLFPEDPWEDNFARGGRAYEVRTHADRYAFVIDEYPGQGYVFAVATRDPFDYRGLVRGDHWDYRAIANSGRVTGDPYVAVQDLVDLMVPANYDAYGYDVVTYYVEQYYEYPRFLCYDCHAFAAFPYWNPYHQSCLRFRIVIYDDPYYYPARVYSATRVVYRVTRVEPRYVFKDRGATDPFLVRVRQRSAEPGSRRADDRGVRGRELGGIGLVPAPGRRLTDRAAPGAEPQSPGGLSAPPRRAEPEPPARPPELGPPERPPLQPEAGPPRRPEAPERLIPGDRARTPPGALAPAVPAPARTLLPPERWAGGRLIEPVEPSRQVPEARPRLERREPPEQRPVPRAAVPERAPSRPPAAQPREPVKKPAAAEPKKPGERREHR